MTIEAQGEGREAATTPAERSRDHLRWWAWAGAVWALGVVLVFLYRAAGVLKLF